MRRVEKSSSNPNRDEYTHAWAMYAAVSMVIILHHPPTIQHMWGICRKYYFNQSTRDVVSHNDWQLSTPLWNNINNNSKIDHFNKFYIPFTAPLPPPPPPTQLLIRINKCVFEVAIDTINQRESIECSDIKRRLAIDDLWKAAAQRQELRGRRGNHKQKLIFGSPLKPHQNISDIPYIHIY